MRWLRPLLLAIVTLAHGCMPTPAPAAEAVPANAPRYLPVLRSAQLQTWPDAPRPAFLAGQVEQESCVSLTSSRCWNPSVQLRTAREWGRGLGQITTAYNADGSVRFDKQAELRAQYASLRGWTAERWADPHYQLLALVEMDHGIYRRVYDAATDLDRLAFTLSGYNGGESGVRQDRLLCRNTRGCDPSKWVGNVDRTSVKSRAPYKGYGGSPYEINRTYVRNILWVRSAKYQPFFPGSAKP
jgi:hypothetical protein